MTFDHLLVERLSAFRASGMDSAAAAAALMKERVVPAPSSGEHPGAAAGGGGGGADAESPLSFGAADLSAALVAVFGDGLTPAELASIIHMEFPDLPALGVAQAVLAGLPNTSETDMYNALTGCGLTAGDAQGAVNVLYPATVTIQANQAWQATGVNVTGQQVTTLTCVSGSWTANPETGMCGANGHPGLIGKPGYTLPGAAEGAVIGQVGSNAPFLVGGSGSAPSGQSGMLSLCINDDLNGRYGLGLVDNQGAMVFTITTGAALPSVAAVQLRNKGGFVCAGQLTWTTDGVNSFSSQRGDDIDLGQEEMLLPNELGVPVGATIRLYIWIALGNDRTGGEYFTYDPSSGQYAAYDITGTTFDSTVNYDGIHGI